MNHISTAPNYNVHCNSRRTLNRRRKRSRKRPEAHRRCRSGNAALLNSLPIERPTLSAVFSWTNTMQRVCVFCGSSVGRNPYYADSARALGELLARRRIGLVFGGGRVGMMGVLADTALAAGGEVIGVIPEAL